MLRGLLYAVAAIKVVAGIKVVATIKVVAAIKGVQNGDQNVGSGDATDGGEAVSERKRAFGGGQNSTLKIASCERATPREID